MADGTIAGSVLTMDRAFALLVGRVGISLPDAAAMCATTPRHDGGHDGVGDLGGLRRRRQRPRCHDDRDPRLVTETGPHEVALRRGLERRAPAVEEYDEPLGLTRTGMFLGGLSQQVAEHRLLLRDDALALLGPDARARGVVASSAGNHGLGVAFAAHALGIAATIFVPGDAPRVKRDGIAALGATLDTSQEGSTVGFPVAESSSSVRCWLAASDIMT